MASNKTLSDKYNEGGKIINFKRKGTKENKKETTKKTKMYAKERTKQRTKQGVAKKKVKRESRGLPPWLLWTSKVSAK